MTFFVLKKKIYDVKEVLCCFIVLSLHEDWSQYISENAGYWYFNKYNDINIDLVYFYHTFTNLLL